MTQELAWMHGEPQASGILKASNKDFIVREELGFAFDGEGEHVMVKVRKTGLNTRFVAEQLAKFAKIAARAVSYAGLKDRNAVTEQWFCMQMPGKETPDFSLLDLEGCQILDVTRQKRKLRIGALKGNHFEIILRNISDKNSTQERLELINTFGVPNYFGTQRFGRNGNNLTQAKLWATNEIRVQDRSKRSFYLSASRSAMFNVIASVRIDKQTYNSVLLGDALQLTGRGSWFVAIEDELAQSQQRVIANELRITAPLPGKGDLGTQADALEFETQQLKEFTTLWQLAEREKVESARRAIIVIPENFQWQWLNETDLQLNFFLPAGSFATSIVREIINQEQDNSLDISE